MDNPTATQGQKQEHVKKGAQLLALIEKSFEQLHDLIQLGCDHGMMDITECHRHQNKSLELKYATLGLHCDLTAIAKRNNCDVGPGGNGGPTKRGGPGR